MYVFSRWICFIYFFRCSFLSFCLFLSLLDYVSVRYVLAIFFVVWLCMIVFACLSACSYNRLSFVCSREPLNTHHCVSTALCHLSQASHSFEFRFLAVWPICCCSHSLHVSPGGQVTGATWCYHQCHTSSIRHCPFWVHDHYCASRLRQYWWKSWQWHWWWSWRSYRYHLI